MAILRGGRRIGNFDIRLGLPRDKSLVDITKDPRLQRKPGGAGTIQRFLAQVNQGEGFARQNRFIVRINLPKGAFSRLIVDYIFVCLQAANRQLLLLSTRGGDNVLKLG